MVQVVLSWPQYPGVKIRAKSQPQPGPSLLLSTRELSYSRKLRTPENGRGKPPGTSPLSPQWATWISKEARRSVTEKSSRKGSHHQAGATGVTVTLFLIASDCPRTKQTVSRMSILQSSGFLRFYLTCSNQITGEKSQVTRTADRERLHRSGAKTGLMAYFKDSNFLITEWRRPPHMPMNWLKNCQIFVSENKLKICKPAQ